MNHYGHYSLPPQVEALQVKKQVMPIVSGEYSRSYGYALAIRQQAIEIGCAPVTIFAQHRSGFTGKPSAIRAETT